MSSHDLFTKKENILNQINELAINSGIKDTENFTKSLDAHFNKHLKIRRSPRWAKKDQYGDPQW